MTAIDAPGSEGPGDEATTGVEPAEPRRRGPGPVQAVVIIVVIALVAGFVGWRIAQPRHPGHDSVDVGFLYDMTEHHDQAIGLSFAYLQDGTDPLLRQLAKEIISYQASEIGMFNTLLEQWGQDGNRPPTMGWMEMAHAGGMPGMASEADVQRLEAATGRELDDLYTMLMIRHHEGGIHMAEDAARRGSSADLRRRATNIADGQRGEIVEMNRWRTEHQLTAVR